jgi:hypothetical protein
VSGDIDIEGRAFTLPSAAVSIERNGRYALAYFTGHAVRLDEDLLETSMDPGAIDLSLVRCGRCPLLAEHSRRLENLLGRVVAVEADGPIMRAIVQFAHGAAPDRLWAMLRDGFPLSLSIGGSIQCAEVTKELPRSPRRYKITQWTLNELSICVYGKDRDAYVRALHTDEDAAQLVRQMQEASDEGRAAVRAALHLDRWDRWAVPAGLRMAVRLGIDSAAVCDALVAEVQQQCKQLISDLAA